MNILREAIDILEDNKVEILGSNAPASVARILLIERENYNKNYAKIVYRRFATRHNIQHTIDKFNEPNLKNKRVTMVDILNESKDNITSGKYPASRASKLLVIDLGYSFYYAKNIFKVWASNNNIKHNIDNF